MPTHIAVGITPDLFPWVMKDVESGVYAAECKLPDEDSFGAIQFVVDNNVLGAIKDSPNVFTRFAWAFGQGPSLEGAKAYINPWFAVAEQYLSNSADNAKAKIEAFVFHPALLGQFPEKYTEDQLRALRLGDAELRYQIGVLACYLLVMRSVYNSKRSVQEMIDTWNSLHEREIPLVRVMYLLGMLFFFGKHDSRLAIKLPGQPRKVQDWASGFFMLRKEERGDIPRWVRNRLFDLLPFLLLPGLNWATHGGIKSRVFLLTKDADIGECFFRLFAWNGDQQLNSLWLLVFNRSSLIESTPSEFDKAISGGRPPKAVEEGEKQSHLQRLLDATLEMLPPDEQSDALAVMIEFQVLRNEVLNADGGK